MPDVSIDTTYGAAFVGLVASAVIYGLTVLQTYTYYRRYPQDSPFIKLVVFTLWVLDSVHLVLCTIAIYWYLIRNFNNNTNLLFNHWSMNLQTDCNGLIGIMVEVFFAMRVYKISKNYYLTTIIIVLACLHFGLGILFTVEAFKLKEYARYSELTWVTSLGLGSAAAADILIALSLCYFLSKNRTGFQRTDTVISTLMLYAINTGLLTSICASAAVVTFATMPTNFVWLSFFWILGKLYVNSLLATLNSRAALRAKAKMGDGSFVQLSQLSHFRQEQGSGSNAGAAFRYPRRKSMALTVQVETTQEMRSDYDDSKQINDGDVTPISLSSLQTPSSPSHAVTFLEKSMIVRSGRRADGDFQKYNSGTHVGASVSVEDGLHVLHKYDPPGEKRNSWQ